MKRETPKFLPFKMDWSETDRSASAGRGLVPIRRRQPDPILTCAYCGTLVYPNDGTFACGKGGCPLGGDL